MEGNIHFAGKSDGWKAGEDNKFMGKYGMTEAALVEILDNVCPQGDVACADFLYKYDEDIEEW